jgi:hypothetical protein
VRVLVELFQVILRAGLGYLEDREEEGLEPEVCYTITATYI